MKKRSEFVFVEKNEEFFEHLIKQLTKAHEEGDIDSVIIQYHSEVPVRRKGGEK